MLLHIGINLLREALSITSNFRRLTRKKTQCNIGQLLRSSTSAKFARPNRQPPRLKKQPKA